MEKIEKLFSSAIGRKGYSVSNKGNNAYKVEKLEQLDQDILKILIIGKCDQYGLEYEIVD
jgi:hypothetical protein